MNLLQVFYVHIPTSTNPPTFLSSPLSQLLGGLVSSWRNALWAGIAAVDWDGHGGGKGGGLHPTQTQSLHSAHAARLATGMPRPGGRNFLQEDLPEKCQAGSDEERNLDGER